MKTASVIAVPIALLLLSLPAIAEEAPASNPGSRLAELSWLEGRWRGPADEGEWEAIYSSPEGGLILSLNKQIIDGRVIVFEFERFVVEGDDVVMAPSPAGRPSEIVFTLTDLDVEARRAVFENPTHDFPQMITYHRLDDDRLRIQVQARGKASLFGFELNLQRQALNSE